MDHWQTMLAGIGAIVAAGVSIIFLRKQIILSELQEARRRSRRLAAARARLPLALSDTIHYGNAALGLLKECLDGIGQQHGLPNGLAQLPKPTLPEQAILSFEALIEATDDDAFAALVADMISAMQVLNSRLNALPTDASGLNALNLHAYIMNAAKINAYASSSFDYARRESDEPPHSLQWDLAISALNLNNIYSDVYPDLHAFFGRARDRAAAAEAG
jgi:hypothetical protein